MAIQKDTILSLVTGIVTVAVQFVIGFFLSPFIVESLGTEANGFSQLAANFVMYASLVSLAFNSMAARFVTVAFHKGELEKARVYYSSIFVVNILLCILFIPLAVYVTLNLEQVIVIQDADINDVKLLFACVFGNFLLGMFLTMYSMAFYVMNKLFYFNMLNCIRTVLNAVLLLVFFCVFPVHVFYISFVALLLGVLLFPVFRHYEYKLLPEIRFDCNMFRWVAVKEMFLSGIWNTINQCGHLLNTGLDLLLSNWFITPFAMGLVAISKMIPSAIIQLATTLNANFSPSITQLWSTRSTDELIQELRSAMKISTVVVSLPIVTFCCVGYEFYTLWQPTLDPLTLTILSVLGCFMFIPVAGPQLLYNVFTATNKLKVNSISFIVMGLLNVLIVYMFLRFLPEYGMYAVVGVSSVLSITRQMVVILPYIAKILNQRWYTFYRDVVTSLLCALINAAIAFGILYAIPFYGWTWLVIKVCIIVLLTIVAQAFVILNAEERRKLKSLLRSKA